jgi:hypothetical protein
MAPDRGSCYAGRMSLVATLAMIMVMLMPATAASIPTVKSAQCAPGYIVSGGYCTPMFPAYSGPASLSGKRDFKTRDEGTETASLIQFLLCRDRALARDPRQLGAN